MKLLFKVHMDSDWHIGSGRGQQGYIDRMVRRDYAGIPYIPGKTMKGMLRDASETMAQGFDRGKSGAWNDWVRFLFGDQPGNERDGDKKGGYEGVLVVSDLKIPESLHSYLSHKKKKPLVQELAILKPGVAVEDSSGRAKDQSFRVIEFARGGVDLFGAVEVHGDLSEEQSKFVEQFLAASLTAIRKIGGHRRRGAGECQVEVLEKSVQDWDELLTLTVPTLPPAATEKPIAAQAASFKQETKDDSWVEIALKIELCAPVVIAKATLGNAVETERFIPGRVLLPALLKQISAHSKTLTAGDLFASGIRVEDAYPLQGTTRCLPAPKCFYLQKKSDQGKNVLNEESLDPRFPRQIDECWIDLNQKDQKLFLKFLKPLDVSATSHNIVSDGPQRPTEEVVGVYTYESLLPGTVLGAVVRVKSSMADSVRSALQSFDARLGTSKNVEYGACRVSVCDAYPAIPRSDGDASYLNVWLLSPMVWSFTCKEGPVEQLRQDLCGVLGAGLSVERCFTRPYRVDQWNTVTRLPRPTAFGLAAGSVLRFSVQGQINEESLRRLETEGLGERLEEGYGRLTFQPAVLSGDTVAFGVYAPPEVCSSLQESPDEYEDLIIGLQRRADMREIREKAARITWEHLIGGKDIKQSQAAAFRSVLKMLKEPLSFSLPSDDKESESKAKTQEELNKLGPIESWFCKTDDSDKRRNHWGKQLHQARDLVCKRDYVWEKLKMKDKQGLWAYAVRVAVEHAESSLRKGGERRGA